VPDAVVTPLATPAGPSETTVEPEVAPLGESGEIVRNDNDLVPAAAGGSAREPPPERPSGFPERAANG